MDTFQVPKKAYVDAYKPSNGARSVGKGELVINIMDAPYNASPTGDPAANTTAINAAIADAVAGNGAVYVPPFSFPTNGITSSSSGLTLYGAGRNQSKITSTSADVLTIAGGSIMLRNVGFTSFAGGGHTVVTPAGSTLSQSHITQCTFVQNNDGKSVWYFNDASAAGGGFFDVHWSDCLFQHKTTATVPGFFAYSNKGNFFSANRFTRCRCHSSGIYFFDIQCDAVNAGYNYNNTWDTINFEVCDGGGIRMWTAMNTGIHNVGFFDNNTITGNLIEFGRSTATPARPQSNGNRITNYHRSGGTLSSGIVDICIKSGQNTGNTTIEGVIGGSSAAGVTIDLGSGAGVATVIGYDPNNVTILNANPAKTILATATNGISTPSITVNGIKYLSGTASPNGNVTGNTGDLYLRTGGSAVSDSRMWVKESGTGTNTGWAAINTTIPVEAFGAVGDGVTSDTSAIQAALNAAGSNGVVTLSPNKTYLCGLLTVKAGTTLQGPGILKASSALANFVILQSNTTLQNLTVDGSGSTNIVRIASVDNVRVDKVHVISSAAGSVGVSILNGTHITVERNDVDGVTTGIQATGNNQFIDILNNHVHGHTNRGIYCSATTGTSTKDLNIVGNLVDELGTIGTGVGAMIQVQGGTGTIERVRVHRNKCIGPNRSHTDPTNPGSIDQINCSTINVIAVTNNISVYGGDCGISGAQNKQYIVANNICEFNDTTGIAVGGSAAHSGPGILVIGNVCKNNSQNRVGDRAPNVGAGVALYDAEDVLVADNQCGDDQTTHTQAYGYTTKGSCSNIQFKNNKSDGARLGAYWDDSTGTEIDFQETRATAIPTSGYWPVGAIVRAKNPVASGNIGWVAVAGGGAASGAWQPNTAYNVGDTVTLAGRVLQCLVAGTSGSSYTVTTWGSLGGVPTPGTDGTVVWQYMSLTTASFKSYGAISA